MSQDQWRRVSKQEFFEEMDRLDTRPRPRGRYDDPDSGADFRTQDGVLVGRTVRHGPIPYFKPHQHYFLRNE